MREEPHHQDMSSTAKKKIKDLEEQMNIEQLQASHI
jgi:hypothetical protein